MVYPNCNVTPKSKSKQAARERNDNKHIEIASKARKLMNMHMGGAAGWQNGPNAQVYLIYEDKPHTQ